MRVITVAWGLQRHDREAATSFREIETLPPAGRTGVFVVVSLNSIAGRLALFVLGHVVVLGLVIGLSMTTGEAVPDRSVGVAADELTTGSLRR
jgi:hypothetical protein